MDKKNSVFIGVSIDGYIADRNGGLEWLDMIPNTENSDMGYFEFMSEIDALVMGRTTFETVCSFDVAWPYEKPVFVLSSTLHEIPESHKGKAFLVKGSLQDILRQIHEQGFHRIYIDGGTTIQNFLKADLIDEIVISTIPVMLGGGAPLFSDLPQHMEFELVKTRTYLDQINQAHYKRKRT